MGRGQRIGLIVVAALVAVVGIVLIQSAGDDDDSPARFRVKANAEGIFELEAHDLGHVIIGKLVVEP